MDDKHQSPPNPLLPHNKEVNSSMPATSDMDSIAGRDGPAEIQNGDAPPALDAHDGTRPQRSKLQIALIMLSLGIAVLLVALDITIVTTALPTIAETFHSASGFTWVGSSYLIANAAATPIWGKVSDIFGRKPILLLTNAIFFLGSLLAGVSVNMNMLIAARVIQGIGGGGLIVLVNICISDLFAMRERGAYFGIIGGVWALASSLGPIVGTLHGRNVMEQVLTHPRGRIHPESELEMVLLPESPFGRRRLLDHSLRSRLAYAQDSFARRSQGCRLAWFLDHDRRHRHVAAWSGVRWCHFPMEVSNRHLSHRLWCRHDWTFLSR
jgi:hypothetical protein